jgi:uroporphyrinogen decarboxylase
MRQAGRYLPEYRRLRAKAGGFLDLCLDAALAAEITLQPVRRFDLDAAILFSDILLVPHALGVKLWFEEGEGPRLDPVADAKALARMGRSLAAAVVEPVHVAARRVRDVLAAEKALIGFCGGPWTVATYLVAGRGSEDKREALKLAQGDPALFGAIIDRLVEASAEHLVGQLRAGADVVQIFDTWAGVLDAEGFRRWCVAPTRAIVARMRAAVPGARVIVFPKGVALPLLAELVAAVGPEAVSIDSDADRAATRALLSPKVAIQGNLDPEILLRGGEALDREVDAICAAFRGARHIFNLGHGVLPTTPVQHVERMVARIKGH